MLFLSLFYEENPAPERDELAKSHLSGDAQALKNFSIFSAQST